MAKKRAGKKPARRPAKKPAKKPSKKPAKRRMPKKRLAKAGGKSPSWFDAASHKPLIGSYVERLKPFMDALADGVIDDAELRAQEKRLVTTMKEVEPKLGSALHGRVTELLCELTAYDVMQMLHAMQSSRPQTKFKG